MFWSRWCTNLYKVIINLLTSKNSFQHSLRCDLFIVIGQYKITLGRRFIPRRVISVCKKNFQDFIPRRVISVLAGFVWLLRFSVYFWRAAPNAYRQTYIHGGDPKVKKTFRTCLLKTFMTARMVYSIPHTGSESAMFDVHPMRPWDRNCERDPQHSTLAVGLNYVWTIYTSSPGGFHITRLCVSYAFSTSQNTVAVWIDLNKKPSGK